MKRSGLHVIALAMLAGSTLSVASAQTAWLNPNSGSWAVAGNWTAGVPLSSDDATLGHTTAYTVSVGNAAVRDVTITNSLANLAVASSTIFSVQGDISNQGALTVNASGGSNNAVLMFGGAPQTLTGTGSIVLNAVSSINDANIQGASVVTQGAGHRITGHGQVYISLVNNGQVISDGPGRYIQLLANPKTNNALFLAQNGATIDVDAITVDQSAGGILRATGANSIAEAHGTIIGGTVEGVSGGIARTGGGLVLDGVDVNGEFYVNSGHTLSVLTSLSNSGTITVNPSAGITNAMMSFNSPAITLDGAGTILLNGIGSINDANLTASVATNVLTQSAGHTITGSGQVYVSMINNGLILAEGGKYIQLLSTAKTNNSLFLAQSGGTIDVDAITVDQTAGGTVRATDANSIAEAHGAILGGTVEGVNGGIVRSGGALLLDGVDLNGQFHVRTGHTVSVLTSLTNTGTITLNPSASIADAVMSFNSPEMTLDGGGTIVLNGGSILDARLSASPATNVLTHAAGHTITGNGQVAAGMINNGLIMADGAGKVVQLMSTGKVNNSLFLAQNGGAIDIDGITVNQTGGGTLRATGAGSIAETHGGITGGTVEGVSGGIVRSGGALLLDAVDLNGTFHIGSGHTVSVATSLTNTGVIVVNSAGASNDAVLSFTSPAMTVDGPGAIVLNSVSGISDARLSASAAANVFTNGQEHMLAGNGQLAVTTTNEGIISPGHALNTDLTQRIELTGAQGDVSCTATSTVRIDIEGSAAGQFDSITGSTGTSFVCNGTLEVSHVGAFTGLPVGTSIDIIVAAGVTGTFSTLVAPALPNNGRYIVAYLPDRVRLIATCYANCDDSTVNPVLTANDFQCFLNKYANGGSYANCDGSSNLPVLTANDFQCFMNRFANGCF